MFSGKSKTGDVKKLWADAGKAGGQVGAIQPDTAITADKELVVNGVKYLHVLTPKAGWSVAADFLYSSSVTPPPDTDPPPVEPPPAAGDVRVDVTRKADGTLLVIVNGKEYVQK